jgi:hypothetical protein
LAEVNFQLLHELRLRAAVPSFHDARRLEVLRDPRVEALAISARPEAPALREAIGKSVAACCELVGALIGERWRWPDLASLRLRAE